MANYRLVSPEAVIDWALLEESAIHYNQYWFWQVLGKILAKVQRKGSDEQESLWDKLKGSSLENHPNLRVQQYYRSLHYLN